MKKNFIAMGDYYESKTYGLVRTIARAIDVYTKDSVIIFTEVGSGGIAGDILSMKESDFKIEIGE